MIIGITGYGCTGASAVVDLLKEFEDVQSYTSSVEFQLLQQPDGIMDLYDAVVLSGRRLLVNTAITRFKKLKKAPGSSQIRKVTHGNYDRLTDDYINSIIQINWKGKSAFDPQDIRWSMDILSLKLINKVLDKLLRSINRSWGWPLKRERYFSFLSKEEFQQKTKKYIENILLASGFDLEQPIILEQLFNTTFPLAGAEFIEEPISIIVDRDPRDVYLLMNHFFSRGTSFMPDTGDVENFIRYYRALHTNHISDEKAIYIQFEDIVDL